MRCLITGIGGFTGQHLARFLREQGATVFGIDSPRRKQPCAADVLCCDLTDRAAVRAFLGRARPEAIFHLVGKTRGDNLGELLAANVETTSVLLELAAELNCAVLVPGSAAEYGFPRELPLTLMKRHGRRLREVADRVTRALGGVHRARQERSIR